jgi:hypothetical protein
LRRLCSFTERTVEHPVTVPVPPGSRREPSRDRKRVSGEENTTGSSQRCRLPVPVVVRAQSINGVWRDRVTISGAKQFSDGFGVDGQQTSSSLVSRDWVSCCHFQTLFRVLFHYSKKNPPDQKMHDRLTVRLLEASARTPTTELLGLAPEKDMAKGQDGQERMSRQVEVGSNHQPVFGTPDREGPTHEGQGNTRGCSKADCLFCGCGEISMRTTQAWNAQLAIRCGVQISDYSAP